MNKFFTVARLVFAVGIMMNGLGCQPVSDSESETVPYGSSGGSTRSGTVQPKNSADSSGNCTSEFTNDYNDMLATCRGVESDVEYATCRSQAEYLYTKYPTIKCEGKLHQSSWGDVHSSGTYGSSSVIEVTRLYIQELVKSVDPRRHIGGACGFLVIQDIQELGVSFQNARSRSELVHCKELVLAFIANYEGISCTAESRNSTGRIEPVTIDEQFMNDILGEVRRSLGEI